MKPSRHREHTAVGIVGAPRTLPRRRPLRDRQQGVVKFIFQSRESLRELQAHHWKTEQVLLASGQGNRLDSTDNAKRKRHSQLDSSPRNDHLKLVSPDALTDSSLFSSHFDFYQQYDGTASATLQARSVQLKFSSLEFFQRAELTLREQHWDQAPS